MIEPRKTIDLPSWLATLYAPFTPLLQKIKLKRVGSPAHNPADILLPKGYTAELVARGPECAGALLFRRPGQLLCHRVRPQD